MLESNVSGDFIERIDESQQPLISKMVSEMAYVAPTVASFSMADLTLDEALTGTYSRNV